MMGRTLGDTVPYHVVQGAAQPRAEASERDSSQSIGVFCTSGAEPPTSLMVVFIDEHRAE